MAEVDSDEDLTKELQPLAYYVSDRKRMLREALRTLKGKRLEAMIPPVLKSWDRPRLESACLNILEDIDDDTLLSILDGRIGTVASALVEQPEPEEPVVKEKIKKTKTKIKKVKVKSAEITVVSDEPKKKKKKKAVVTQDPANESKLAKLKKKKKLLKAKKLKEKLKKKKKAAAAAEPTAVDGEPSAAAPHKSLMELLELEYRAKAIKALLRSQGQTVPDIPMEVEGEEQGHQSVSPATPKPEEVNGDEGKKSKASTGKKVPVQSTTKKNQNTPTLVEKESSKKNGNTPKVVEKQSPKKSANSSKAVERQSPKKSAQESPKKSSNLTGASTESSQKEESNKGVIDLIDDALNTSFSEVTADVATSAIEPSSVIVQAIAKKDSASEEDLRSKLLRKYQQQKQETQVKSEQPQVKKKRKKKKELPKEEEDDVLELHPQELCLDEDDHRVEQESSVEEEEEEEEEEIVNEEVQSKTVQEVQEDEQLIYDDTDEEEEQELVANSNQAVHEDEENSNSSVQEKTLWAEVEEGIKVASDNATAADNELSQGEHPSENIRSGVFSDTTRDDVFETATVGNMKGKGISFNSAGGGFKKKLTFRIDPARIKVLEEQAAEEEAKREEERKRIEEEERLRRLAEEPEEGEIDSNDDIVSEEEEVRGKETPDKPRETSKSPSKSPVKRREHSDSEDSQDSTSYYARRRPYKRQQASPSRDFGKYSPQRNAAAVENKEDEKRPSSPVDFITQYSDMEPISDEDSNQSQPKKKVGPVQGCAEKPAGTVESNSEDETKDKDLKTRKDDAVSEPEENEEDEDELPKPVTWYERWAQSHGMSKVAKANKIHRKVKSKLKQVKTQTKKHPEIPKIPEPTVEAEPIIGSIEEYEKLFGKKVVVKPAEQEDENINNVQDDEDEEDADDLWGDILGGS